MTQLQVERLVDLPNPQPALARIRDPRRPPDLRWPHPVVLGLFCLVLFFQGINTGDLWRTENLRALIAREFLRSGDWIVPRLYGEPYLTKPPGMYAAIALVSWPIGDVRTWSARLPSALAATAKSETGPPRRWPMQPPHSVSASRPAPTTPTRRVATRQPYSAGRSASWVRARTPSAPPATRA